MFFCEIQQKLAKLVEFTVVFFFNSKIYPISLSKNGEIWPWKKREKKHWYYEDVEKVAIVPRKV
jgi:hypothetical protein